MAWSRSFALVLFLFGSLTPFWAAPAWAADDVDLALVLVTDVSRSIDDAEFALEKDGYSAALTSEQVVSAAEAAGEDALAPFVVDLPVQGRCGAGIQRQGEAHKWTAID